MVGPGILDNVLYSFIQNLILAKGKVFHGGLHLNMISLLSCVTMITPSMLPTLPQEVWG